MTCYLFGGTKGGVGKSTMACNAAAWLAEDAPHQAIGLLDTDVQRHASAWAQLRAARRAEAGSTPDVLADTAFGPGKVRESVEALRGQTAHIVIDAGGRDSAELRGALISTDVLVMPFLPSQFDLYSVRDLLRLVDEARGYNPKLRVIAFVNRASNNWTSRLAEDARSAIAEVFPVASTIVHERQVFSTVVPSGRAVFEVGRRGEPAASEFTSLWLEIEGAT